MYTKLDNMKNKYFYFEVNLADYTSVYYSEMGHCAELILFVL